MGIVNVSWIYHIARGIEPGYSLSKLFPFPCDYEKITFESSYGGHLLFQQFLGMTPVSCDYQEAEKGEWERGPLLFVSACCCWRFRDEVVIGEGVSRSPSLKLSGPAVVGGHIGISFLRNETFQDRNPLGQQRLTEGLHAPDS